MDDPDMATATCLKDKVPLTKAGAFNQTVFNHQRFDRVSDHFKS
jgi:hypothetical protein